ncbi:MAG TPA: DNA/pantothenate metabolism flavoprotein domain protein, partial [Verrucomicrobiae bacterium]|nr:DNA/pantothenate metabolism flavoprotein domain protein [Verrucomicrobiae bacterium]
LLPTPKIISELREWHPRARLVGWKYEVEGDRAAVITLAERQIAECNTDACVINGPAYGRGFGLMIAGKKNTHLPNAPTLFAALEKFVRKN